MKPVFSKISLVIPHCPKCGKRLLDKDHTICGCKLIWSKRSKEDKNGIFRSRWIYKVDDSRRFEIIKKSGDLEIGMVFRIAYPSKFQTPENHRKFGGGFHIFDIWSGDFDELVKKGIAKQL